MSRCLKVFPLMCDDALGPNYNIMIPYNETIIVNAIYINYARKRKANQNLKNRYDKI